LDAEDASRQALTRELEGRYGADYRIVSSASPEDALARLEQLRGDYTPIQQAWSGAGSMATANG
jgi:hypothetical protein